MMKRDREDPEKGDDYVSKAQSPTTFRRFGFPDVDEHLPDIVLAFEHVKPDIVNYFPKGDLISASHHGQESLKSALV